ncbi:thiamine phosphate synthase [bacterium]|nr:thiamine phosphate synthase [bacterium]
MPKNYLSNNNLYLILDTSYIRCENLAIVADECCGAGVDIVQFRNKKLSDKTALKKCKEILKITQSYGIPFIINDRFDLALAVGADGVHIGQDDLPVEFIRKITHRLNKKFIIGLSTHSLSQAEQADSLGIDYIGIGPLFCTMTKPDYSPIGLDCAAKVFQKIKTPAYAIGGINENNLRKVCGYGINRIAVVSAILQSDNKTKIIKKFKKFIMKGN